VLRTAESGALGASAQTLAGRARRRDYTTVSFYNGRPASGLAVPPGHRRQRARHGRRGQGQSTTWPKFSRRTEARRHTTPRHLFRLSIREVVKTLLEAFVLVFLVMYLFLQNIRRHADPAIAVPVVLLGAFGAMAAFGFRSTF